MRNNRGTAPMGFTALWFTLLVIAIAWICAAAGCAGTFGGEHHWLAPRDSALEVAWGTVTVLAACDTAGTVWTSHGGAYDRQTAPGKVLMERDPVLTAIPGVGERPGPAMLIAGNAALNAANYGATRAPVPRWARWAWFGVLAGVETFAIASNARYTGACGLAGQRDLRFANSARR